MMTCLFSWIPVAWAMPIMNASLDQIPQWFHSVEGRATVAGTITAVLVNFFATLIQALFGITAPLY